MKGSEVERAGARDPVQGLLCVLSRPSALSGPPGSSPQCAAWPGYLSGPPAVSTSEGSMWTVRLEESLSAAGQAWQC